VALLCRHRDTPPFIFSSGKPVSGKELAFESQDSPLYVRLPGDFMHRYVFRRMTRVATSSSRLREVLIKQVKVRPDKVSVTPFIAAELERFYPGVETARLRKGLGLAEADRVVLCLGEVSPYKNQLSLVKAIPGIVARHPETRFVFAGAILDDYQAQIDEFVRAHSLDDRVIFTGFVRDYADLPAYYNLADVYILLSRSEGNLPKTILEAMSCGRAVIAADIPQNREGARRGDEIVFVDPYDTGAIAAAVNRLLDDPALRQRLGENAHQSTLKYHAPEVIAQGMVRLYEDVLATHH
jgi:glycosyltransferase involved in cell wall biosynthesis